MKQDSLFTLMKKDHRTVEGLFGKIAKTSEKAPKKRMRLYRDLRNEIAVHSQAEERAVYPRLKQKPRTEDSAFESVEKHGVMKGLLKKLDTVSCETKQWSALLCVLQQTVEHHVEEEEGMMFRWMRISFSKQELDEMALAFQEAKAMRAQIFQELAAA